MRRKWQPDAMLLHNPVRSNEKITGAADPKIGRCLIDGLLDRNGVNPYIQCCVEHVLKFAHALAAKQGGQDTKHPFLFREDICIRGFVLRKI